MGGGREARRWVLGLMGLLLSTGLLNGLVERRTTHEQAAAADKEGRGGGGGRSTTQHHNAQRAKRGFLNSIAQRMSAWHRRHVQKAFSMLYRVPEDRDHRSIAAVRNVMRIAHR